MYFTTVYLLIMHKFKLKELVYQLKSEKTNDETDDSCTSKKQLTISESFSQQQYVSQGITPYILTLDSMITEFVILGNHTFSIVKEEKFKYLMNKCFPKHKCLTRKTLIGRISTIAQEIKK
ncbi:Uncharacterized protein FWK35_00020927 [Aphis craccivora]|uniref:Uncharacterized protein n=1 Tax=Aphis craccivora TaxID=307492 RepID=A0A6G0Y3N9_APHCR|nr:Uncharacterized protein FWK35_00020927 [Aphis craccivora]